MRRPPVAAVLLGLAAPAAGADLVRLQRTAFDSFAVAETAIAGALETAVANLDADSDPEAVALRPGAVERWELRPAPIRVQTIQLAADPAGVALADVTGDGRPDLVIGTADRRLLLYPEQGGQFAPAPAALARADAPPGDLHARDLDGDGRADVVACGGRCVVAWGPALEPVEALPLAGGGTPRRVRTGDFDADGRLDLAVLEQDRERLVLLSSPAPRVFLLDGTAPTGRTPSDLLVADLDGDGRAEAVVTALGSATLAAFARPPGGGLAELPGSPLLVGARPFSLGLARGAPAALLVFDTSNLEPLVLPAPALAPRLDTARLGGFLPYEPGVLLVGFSPPARRDALLAAIEALPPALGPPRVEGALEEISVFVVRVPPPALATARAAIAALAGVAFVEPDFALAGASDDPLFASQWALAAIDAEPAWAIEAGSLDVTLAVLDTGIDPARPDLAGLVRANPAEAANGLDDDGNLVADDLEGADFVKGTWQRTTQGGREIFRWLDPGTGAGDDDVGGHGSAVAELAAAIRDNAVGIAGVCKASLERIQVLDAARRGRASAVAHGLLYAVRRGARVANLSLGGPIPSRTLARATAHASGAGLVVVAAAGNRAGLEVDVPARHADVVAVGAIDSLLVPAPFSNRGAGLDLLAPGVAVTDAGGILRTGTSFAAPHASGVAALLAAVHPGLDAPRARAWLRATASDLVDPGPDSTSGFGLLQAGAAVERAAACAARGGPACRAAPAKKTPGEEAVRFRAGADTDLDGEDDEAWVDGSGFIGFTRDL